MTHPTPMLELCDRATPGPYFVSHDNTDMDCDDYRAHVGSGLAVVDTGRASDWPIARFCEWPTAQFIARCSPDTMRRVVEALRACQSAMLGRVHPKDPAWTQSEQALRLLDGLPEEDK